MDEDITAGHCLLEVVLAVRVLNLGNPFPKPGKLLLHSSDRLRRYALDAFPLEAFSERAFELRLADKENFDREEFSKELLRLAEHRMVVPRANDVSGGTVYMFRHEKVMDFFLYHAFLNDPKRQADYLQDSRFRGVYLLLATLLPYQDALALRETLITRAAETRDHSLSDEFVQLIQARALATVLFADVVESTALQARIGDASWTRLMDQHDEICKAQVMRRAGKLVKFTGDGLLATFLAPSNALACAIVLRAEVAALGLQVRFGVHTGEIEHRGDDVAGLGVVVAARIVDHAAGGQVLVSDLTRQLTLGSKFEFSMHGEYELKGIPEKWTLYQASLP